MCKSLYTHIRNYKPKPKESVLHQNVPVRRAYSMIAPWSSAIAPGRGMLTSLVTRRDAASSFCLRSIRPQDKAAKRNTSQPVRQEAFRDDVWYQNDKEVLRDYPLVTTSNNNMNNTNPSERLRALRAPAVNLLHLHCSAQMILASADSVEAWK